MSLTLAYESTLSRVSINASGLYLSTEVTVERSPDQITWTTVRGGADAGVTSGTLDLPIYDYEFSANQINYYRVQVDLAAQDTFTRTTSNGWGTADTGEVWSTSGGAASNYATNGTKATILLTDTNARFTILGSTVFTNATVRVGEISNPGAVTPTGASITLGPTLRYTDTSNFYQARLLLGTGNDVTLQIRKVVAGSSTSLAVSSAIASATASGTPMSLLFETSGTTLRAKAWRMADPEPAAWTLSVTDASLASGKAGMNAARESGNTNTNPTFAFDSVTVDDGDPHTLYSSSITPDIEAVWLKSVARPFLNTTVELILVPPVRSSQPARVGVFDIVGRSLPVAVSDVRGSKRWTVQLRAETEAEDLAIGYLLASGDVLFLQAPPTCPLPMVEAYVTVGDVDREYHPLRPRRVTYTLPLTEVAAPGPDVVGAQSTWQTVIDTYATWTDVISAHATWADLLTLIGSGSEVIVP